jgi:hypothetical protein
MPAIVATKPPVPSNAAVIKTTQASTGQPMPTTVSILSPSACE